MNVNWISCFVIWWALVLGAQEVLGGRTFPKDGRSISLAVVATFPDGPGDPEIEVLFNRHGLKEVHILSLLRIASGSLTWNLYRGEKCLLVQATDWSSIHTITDDKVWLPLSKQGRLTKFSLSEFKARLEKAVSK